MNKRQRKKCAKNMQLLEVRTFVTNEESFRKVNQAINPILRNIGITDIKESIWQDVDPILGVVLFGQFVGIKLGYELDEIAYTELNSLALKSAHAIYDALDGQEDISIDLSFTNPSSYRTTTKNFKYIPET
ncbi:hypothetical protein BAU15_14835 [Enterococcus sp. JM4C]|uniref:hypothetical protein n=1 Tax=Candidatus Enterococcus huntleyi TaxID=1857217 RepID=UPI00137A0A18|nr:hypothetical protein [Enterococcus sp. JM4C]KAF1296614.1 hypothetical protein BAU15_14835 [Enterococcus sp. JM4C]